MRYICSKRRKEVTQPDAAEILVALETSINCLRFIKTIFICDYFIGICTYMCVHYTCL